MNINDEYRLSPGTQPYRLAKAMQEGWVSALMAATTHRIVCMHARLADITRAGGSYESRNVSDGEHAHFEYRMTVAPSFDEPGARMSCVSSAAAEVERQARVTLERTARTSTVRSMRQQQRVSINPFAE